MLKLLDIFTNLKNVLETVFLCKLHKFAVSIKSFDCIVYLSGKLAALFEANCIYFRL